MCNVLGKLKNIFTKYKKPILQSLIFVGYIVALVFLFILIVNLNIVAKTNDNIYSIDETVKLDNDYDCILILGAGIKADGSPTPMLRDRLIAAFQAHQQINDVTVFISGDSKNSDYCETVTMKTFLTDRGVDNNKIICDGYGLSTYESIWRAKEVYGYDKILIVTQKYHLHRAIYIAQKLGITAYGFDGALTTYRKQPLYSFREYIARVKDMLYTEIEPKAKYTDIWRDTNE